MASIDSIEWIEWLQIYALDQPDLVIGRFPKKWLMNMCDVALQMCKAECPNCAPRYQKGYLKEQTVAFVVCQMVLRVVRFRQYKTETNGVYTYTNFDPQDNPPMKDGSSNLYLSKRERALLNGYSEDSTPIGTIEMGLDRAYGL